MSGTTAQDSNWKYREQAEEARYTHQKEQEQLEAIRQNLAESKKDGDSTTSDQQDKHPMDRDFEAGFGGQEDLEDRYATTSGEH